MRPMLENLQDLPPVYVEVRINETTVKVNGNDVVVKDYWAFESMDEALEFMERNSTSKQKEVEYVVHNFGKSLTPEP